MKSKFYGKHQRTCNELITYLVTPDLTYLFMDCETIACSGTGEKRIQHSFGNEEQKTIFPVVSWPNLIGGRGTVMHLDIERNEIEFAHTSSTKFSTKSQIPTCHKTLFFSRSF